MQAVKVSHDQRFLMTEQGEPFFWLGDTAWELFHYLTNSEAEYYLEIRHQQGFNVIQAAILPETDSLHTPNANGHLPLIGDDPTRPNEYYFRFVDSVIEMTKARGMYIGLVPTWADKVFLGQWGIGPLIFTLSNAHVYGQFLGERYRNAENILWILGGDRPASGVEAVWDALANGITSGLGRQPFFTYHPNGGHSSGQYLHNASWLAMNMTQSGHVVLDTPNWSMITTEYQRQPAKPVLDGEPCYEDHPIDPFLRQWQPEHGRYTDYDVRKAAYRAVFAGACGHTYGHHSVWQFWSEKRQPINFAMPMWQEAILRPGAKQMIFLKKLMLARRYFGRVPAQELLLDAPTPQSSGDLARFDPLRAAYPAATCSKDDDYAMVYFPLAEQKLTVDLRQLSGKVRASWYDPRTGKEHPIGEFPNKPTTFTSPVAGPDWVLILDQMMR